MKATRKLPFLLSLRHSQDTQSADADADILKWVLLSSLCRISGIHRFAFLNEIQLLVFIYEVSDSTVHCIRDFLL